MILCYVCRQVCMYVNNKMCKLKWDFFFLFTDFYVYLWVGEKMIRFLFVCLYENVCVCVWELVGNLIYWRFGIVVVELMLLGFISLLLTVFQSTISKICVHQDVLDNMLPCKRNKTAEADGHKSHDSTTSHFQTFFSSSISSTARHLLAEEESAASELGYCARRVSIIIHWPIGAYDTCTGHVMK